MDVTNFHSYVSGKIDHSSLYPRAWDLVINKLKNIDFVKNLGIRVPKTYWVGKYNQIPWDTLPKDFVIKPVSGSSSRGVYIIKNGLDISTGKLPDYKKIETGYEKQSKFTGYLLGESNDNRDLVYVTELIGDKFADDYKFYIFNGKVQVIRYNNYLSKKEKKSSYFDTNWNHKKGIVPQNVWQDKKKPSKLKLMIDYSQKIAEKLNVPFLRVDFYLDNEDPVFGELCMTPNGGKHYLPETLKWFSSLLLEHSPKINKIKYDATVIVPTFNNVDYLNETLNSINLSGQKNNVEILVGIDGCDKTLEFVRNNFFDDNIKFLFFTENGGPYTIKNTLVEQANSENIIFFDSDDVMNENLIPKILNSLQSSSITKFRFMNFVDNYNTNLKINRHTNYAEGVFGVKRDLFLQMNGFEPWVCAADSDFWGRIYKSKIKINFINDILMLRRLHEVQLTRRNDTGMKSTLRSHYWKLSKSKKGDGNPKFLSTRNFYQIDDINSKKIKIDYINFLEKKRTVIENIKNLLVSNNLVKPQEKLKKQPPVELNYDLVNKLMSKKLNLQENLETKQNLTFDRQNLFDLKRKKV